jgi:hypothetical protein
MARSAMDPLINRNSKQGDAKCPSSPDIISAPAVLPPTTLLSAKIQTLRVKGQMLRWKDDYGGPVLVNTPT